MKNTGLPPGLLDQGRDIRPLIVDDDPRHRQALLCEPRLECFLCLLLAEL